MTNTPERTAPALERKYTAFTGMDSARDYRKAYRAAFAFHEAHNPPAVDVEYWKTHTPGRDDPPQLELDYWERVAFDLGRTCTECGNDPFYRGLALAVFDELEREYNAARYTATDARDAANAKGELVNVLPEVRRQWSHCTV